MTLAVTLYVANILVPISAISYYRNHVGLEDVPSHLGTVIVAMPHYLSMSVWEQVHSVNEPSLLGNKARLVCL